MAGLCVHHLQWQVPEPVLAPEQGLALVPVQLEPVLELALALEQVPVRLELGLVPELEQGLELVQALEQGPAQVLAQVQRRLGKRQYLGKKLLGSKRRDRDWRPHWRSVCRRELRARH